ncbi:MAG: methyltransferase domain-containing protein [Bacteroidota bacterium]|jgi:2-polyprenyl-3-methyl-5-hydroxy-6-metoxy-1,4-benzoquinol methylase
MMGVLPRSAQKEIMDDVTIQDGRLDEAFRELSVINTWLGGNTTSRKGVKTLLKQKPPANTLSILDVGAGGSDIAQAISSVHSDIKITSLDLNKRACAYAAQANPSLTVVHGSVLDLPFHKQTFDIIHASLFLHHFTEQELHHILPSLYSTARFGIVINDLRRSLFAYLGIYLLTRLFSRSVMVKNDGPLSVRRGFTRSELLRLCASLPSASYTVQRTWAFRWLVCIVKLT